MKVDMVYYTEDIDDELAQAVDKLWEAGKYEEAARLIEESISMSEVDEFTHRYYDSWQVKTTTKPLILYNQWPRGERVQFAVVNWRVYSQSLHTGFREIDNPDWDGNPVDVVEYEFSKPNGRLVLMEAHV